MISFSDQRSSKSIARDNGANFFGDVLHELLRRLYPRLANRAAGHNDALAALRDARRIVHEYIKLVPREFCADGRDNVASRGHCARSRTNSEGRPDTDGGRSRASLWFSATVAMILSSARSLGGELDTWPFLVAARIGRNRTASDAVSLSEEGGDNV